MNEMQAYPDVPMMIGPLGSTRPITGFRKGEFVRFYAHDTARWTYARVVSDAKWSPDLLVGYMYTGHFVKTGEGHLAFALDHDLEKA